MTAPKARKWIVDETGHYTEPSPPHTPPARPHAAFPHAARPLARGWGAFSVPPYITPPRIEGDSYRRRENSYTPGECRVIRYRVVPRIMRMMGRSCRERHRRRKVPVYRSTIGWLERKPTRACSSSELQLCRCAPSVAAPRRHAQPCARCTIPASHQNLS